MDAAAMSTYFVVDLQYSRPCKTRPINLDYVGRLKLTPEITANQVKSISSYAGTGANIGRDCSYPYNEAESLPLALHEGK